MVRRKHNCLAQVNAPRAAIRHRNTKMLMLQTSIEDLDESMLHYALPPTALERSLHIARWEKKPRQNARGKQPEQTTAQPQDKTPRLSNFCARNPSQRRTRRSKKYENVPVHAYQPIRSHVINRSTHGVSPNVDSSTLRGPVCCGSVIVCPCCRRGRWSCARSSCPQYCVCWARIACQR